MSNIITPNIPQAQPAPLTIQEASTIGGALHRYYELSGQTIQTPDSEAEKRGLQSFLNEKLLLHAEVFLGAFFTIKTEYEPLIQTICRIAERVYTINTRAAQLRAEQ